VNAWPYIVAAYVLTVAATLALVVQSWLAMRRAEATAEKLGRDR
jgi:uncharacterized SAM-binding protein YcdF (DUF218 family)